jgi:hypothetical protein
MRLRRFVEKGNRFVKRLIRLEDFQKNGVMPIGV